MMLVVSFKVLQVMRSCSWVCPWLIVASILVVEGRLRRNWMASESGELKALQSQPASCLSQISKNLKNLRRTGRILSALNLMLLIILGPSLISLISRLTPSIVPSMSESLRAHALTTPVQHLSRIYFQQKQWLPSRGGHWHGHGMLQARHL
jgi:hypothetical protein